jgi:bifunctional UDP-N-acetylglucosamine pyrophosphorylase/glucosamine-1-phosphate N-acetyltransferase
MTRREGRRNKVSEQQKGEAGLAVVIMAAGKGTRLKTKRPKVLHQIGGRPLVAHVIAAARALVAPEQIYVVIGHQAERVREALASTGVSFIEQIEQRGTGHAIQCARAAIAGYEDVLVLSGDVPLITAETIERIWAFHKAENAAMTLLSATPEDPTGYGRVIRRECSEFEVEAIVEQKSLAAGQKGIREINSGIYAFRTAPLFEHLHQLHSNNPHGELYLTDMAGILRSAGERVVAIEAHEAAEVLGANTIAELVSLDATLRARTAARLMASGVTIFRPETCLIDAEVEIEADTVIEPFVQLRGRTRIGADTTIRSYTVIENCTLGADVLVRQSCVLADSTVADGARIGPFAHVRPGTEIGENVHVGNFVETKKARLGEGESSHLPGRRRRGRRHQCGRRCDYLQLRRREQVRNPHRQGSFRGQRYHACGSPYGWGWSVYRRRIVHYKGSSARSAGGGAGPASEQGRLGGGQASQAEIGFRPL